MGRLNRPAQQGYQYRSPSQTNARDRVPNALEESIPATANDARRVMRYSDIGETPEQTETRRRSPLGNISTKDAADRASRRIAVRGGLANIAYEGGKAAGRALDEKYPELGKKIVDRTVGPAIDKMVEKSRDKVELSKDAKRRVKEESDELDRVNKSVDTRGDFDYEPTARMMGMKKGGAVKMAKGGSVSSASSRADGCAQRGKTKGRML
jgi:hypothetical protein